MKSIQTGGVRQASRTAAAAAGLALLTSFISASPAAADNGDGWEPCNSGEICLYQAQYQYEDNNNGTRQFWYDDMDHRNDRFWLSGINESGSVVMDKMRSIHNRDTQCGVRLWDVNGSGTWYVYKNVAFGGVSGTRVNVNSYNNGHDRYPC